MNFKSKPLAFLLMLGLANLGVYLPGGSVSPCSCSKYQSCRMDHDCPHCTTQNKLAKEPSGDMCHSGKHQPQAAKVAVSASPEAETLPNRKTVKIFNPTCGAGVPVSFAPQARDPFMVTEYFVCKQDLDRSFFSPTSLLPPEEVDLTLPDKPPRLISLLS